MIYFIQDTNSKAIKIGISRNPVDRLATLQTAHPAKLKLIGLMDGGQTEERTLHKKFSRLEGEWFEPTPDLLAFICHEAISLGALAMPVAPTMAAPVRLLPQRLYAFRTIVYLAALWIFAAILATFGIYQILLLTAPYIRAIPLPVHLVVIVIDLLIIYRVICRTTARRLERPANGW